jgi:acylphosphatase
MKSIIIIVEGHVQGVFFRSHVEKEAKELKLVGYVRNLNDGNVEIGVEGSEEKIKEFVKFCKSNPGSSKVESIKIKDKKMEGFDSFMIKY